VAVDPGSLPVVVGPGYRGANVSGSY
jgi:hypothetical protein